MRIPAISAAALLLPSLLISGCVTTVAGDALPADTSGPMHPDPLPASALKDLLLDLNEVSSVTASTGLKVLRTRDQPWDDGPNIANKACVLAHAPAEAPAYADTGWKALRTQLLDDSTDESGNDRMHFVVQAVTSFADADAVSAFYTKSTHDWDACSGAHYTYAEQGQPDVSWTIGKLSSDNDMLSFRITQDDGGGWSCNRVLTVRNNVAIDIKTCSHNSADPAAADMAEQIAARVSNP